MKTNPLLPHYIRLFKTPQTFRKLTGISPEKFLELKRKLEPLYREMNEKRLNQRKRQRQIGGGNQHRLCLGDRLLLLLIYYRTYTTYAFLSFVFNLDESNVG